VTIDEREQGVVRDVIDTPEKMRRWGLDEYGLMFERVFYPERFFREYPVDLCIEGSVLTMRGSEPGHRAVGRVCEIRFCLSGLQSTRPVLRVAEFGSFGGSSRFTNP